MADVGEVLRQLKAAGYKCTGKRQAIVALFVDHPGQTFSAKDVYTYVLSMYPNLSLDTVYRTLELLLQHRIIERLDGADDAARFRLACEEPSHHHHVVCLRCGKSIPIHVCPIEAMREEMDDFDIVDHTVAIYGYCRPCREQNAGQSRPVQPHEGMVTEP
ncbi:transcriptional repressor [Alicyclobacillus cellulosilyticus]|uniref:Transcriptional repressor n=1 Tax=Alicyclobacillus cellulosilyticus TaxID=1003997 RepID=A0A917KG65_9BACL|nr:Fur family transcriptional regulator [Alicyclobacillus cellulosilyticus]GGJ12996.1 transcriptional repressor [Alicyclobacillus cellulosilyticus]